MYTAYRELEVRSVYCHVDCSTYNVIMVLYQVSVVVRQQYGHRRKVTELHENKCRPK